MQQFGSLRLTRESRLYCTTFGEAGREELFEVTPAVLMACRTKTRNSIVGQIVIEKTWAYTDVLPRFVGWENVRWLKSDFLSW